MEGISACFINNDAHTAMLPTEMLLPLNVNHNRNGVHSFCSFATQHQVHRARRKRTHEFLTRRIFSSRRVASLSRVQSCGAHAEDTTAPRLAPRPPPVEQPPSSVGATVTTGTSGTRTVSSVPSLYRMWMSRAVAATHLFPLSLLVLPGDVGSLTTVGSGRPLTSSA